MRRKIINLLYKNKHLHWLLYIFHLIVGKNKFVFSGSQLNYHNAVLYRNTFDQEKNKNNSLVIDNDTFISNSSFIFKGSNNSVIIGSGGFINGLILTIEGDDNTILIGNKIFILDDTRMIVVDGSQLLIGDNCMFSDRIDIRTTDNHSIIDKHTNSRVNYEENIIIGNSVWIGTGVNILKGVELASGTIVGARSVVTHKHAVENSIIVGNPAKLIKENVYWKMERIK